ncbi:MAG: hypothetical protein ACI4VF_02945 [Lachnospirales bacterium]
MNKLNNEKLISLVVYKLKDTLFNLMYDILDNPLSEIPIVPERLKDFEERIRSFYTQICDNLSKEINDRENFISAVNLLENDIVNMAIDINKYTCANNQLGEYVLREMKLIEVSNIDESVPLNNHAMVEKISHFLSHIEDNVEGKFAKGELIAALPIRMTKDRYRDYVKSAFSIMAKELPKEFANSSMERLKDMCLAESKNLSCDLPLMADTINEIYNIDTSEFKKENIEEYLNIIDDNIASLQTIYTCLGVLYNDVTYIKILCDFVIDEDFLFEDDFLLKDLYYSVCDTIKDKDESLVDTILERVNNEIEKRFEMSKELEGEITKEISQIKDINELDDNCKVSVQVNNAISNAYLKDIDEKIMLGQGGDKSIDELSDELCNYIEDVTKNLPNSRRKYIKQRFLQHIPCPMTDNEFTDYAHYSLSGVNDRNVILASCGDIFDITDKVLDSNHHHDENCDCSHHHHHHHHDENCNCGHHH